jgi:hypothetical protein
MNQAQKVFEAIQRSKGHTDFAMGSNGKYNSPALQVRWNYFQLGWEMAKVNKE